MEQDSKCCLVADEGDAKRTLISELEGGTPPSRRCREEGSAPRKLATRERRHGRRSGKTIRNSGDGGDDISLGCPHRVSTGTARPTG
eukprot:COSAG06_NODE_48700_length_330_cov_0.870130_1_plen_86_part_01